MLQDLAGPWAHQHEQQQLMACGHAVNDDELLPSMFTVPGIVLSALPTSILC